MQTLKCCSLYIPLLFGWQRVLQHSFNQCSFINDLLFPLDPQGTAFTQVWITHHGGDYQRHGLPCNKHQHTPHLRCLLEEWFHLRSLVSRGQSSSFHLAPSFVSWCCSRSSHCSAGAQDSSTISSVCLLSAWDQESSGWSWGMAEVVSWPLSQTCPRCHWKRLNMHLEENDAGERSYQHLLYLLVHTKRSAVLSMEIQTASIKGFVTYGHCANFIAHQREEYALQWAFSTILDTPLISCHSICPYERSQTAKLSSFSMKFKLSSKCWISQLLPTEFIVNCQEENKHKKQITTGDMTATNTLSGSNSISVSRPFPDPNDITVSKNTY